MRVVHIVTPSRSGLYQFHCNLLPGLTERGCKVSWLSSGAAHAESIAEFDGTRTEGEIVASDTDDPFARTNALVRQIAGISPDVLIYPALGDPIELNAIRFISGTISKILILHSSSLATYRGARAVRDYTSVTIAISRRIEQDLIQSYGFPAEGLRLIPHGVDTSRYLARAVRNSSVGPVRILSHGRVVKEKGAYWIPEILSQLARKSDNWKCTISGDGPDLAGLKRSLDKSVVWDRVRFTGWTPSEMVPKLMDQHDIFLFLSQSEGNPLALAEAMAGGCVPVASHLVGITDWLIEDGVNGVQFPIGDTRSAAKQISALIGDRGRLAGLSQRAQESVSKFNLDWMSEQYYQLFSQMISNPRPIAAPERLDNYGVVGGLKPAWWYRLPSPLKNRLRVAREKMRGSIRVP